MAKIRGLRWWMIGLIMLGSILNYLTRSSLAVAAPTLLHDLHITEKQYSWILGAFQGTITLQPVSGYVMDVVGLKIGFAIFALAWSLTNMAHALAGSWQGFAFLRGLMGFSEGSANPAGMKATAEWFPARGEWLASGAARRQHSGGRSGGAGHAELHRRIRGNLLPGSRGHAAARGFRLLYLSGAGIPV